MDKKNSFRVLEHRRIPYANAAGNRITFPEEALYGVGLLQCPACRMRVALTSISGILAYTHIHRSPGCPFSRRGYGWARPSAIFSIYGRIRSCLDQGKPEAVQVVRRCYTCHAVRPESLSKSIGGIVMEYNPARETGPGIRPDIVLLDKQGSPNILLFVGAGEEKFEIPVYLRKCSSFIVQAKQTLEDSRVIQVVKSYATKSPECPCQQADRISCQEQEGQSLVACPKETAKGGKASISLAICLRCPYHLSLFHNTVTCGYSVNITRHRGDGEGTTKKSRDFAGKVFPLAKKSELTDNDAEIPKLRSEA